MTVSDLKNDISCTEEKAYNGCPEIGRKIKERRLVRGYTQEDLGNKVGVTFQQIQKYESGRNNITIDRLYAIAEALSVNITALLLDDTSTFLAPTALHEESCFEYNSSECDSEMLNLMREYKKIKSKESREAVRALVKSLTSPQ